MKARAPRIHLLDVSEPLTKYTEVTVRCGEILKDALPKFMFEFGVMGGPAYLPLMTCRKCLSAPMGEVEPEKIVYLYGLVNAQETLGEN